MLNQVIIAGFTDGGIDRLRVLADLFVQVRVAQVNSLGDVLATTEQISTAAVVVFLESAPTEAQVEIVQRLAMLKIPTLAVGGSGFSNRDRLAALDEGFVGVVTHSGIETRLRALLEMFIVRGNLRTEHMNRKVENLQEAGLLFASPEIKELLSRLDRVAGLGSTILLTGETGVGKSTIARWIHQQSARAAAPFVDVPCAALPATLLESELFGHVRGAFTSADRDQVGKFKIAGRGTMLLDEVDCLPLEVQGKLLRAVERREFERVGSTVTEKFEARLIVATNRPLEQEVSAGRFRADLYYRFGVLSFRVPALRERQGAIRPLAEMFAQGFAQEHNRAVSGFSPAAMTALESHRWPGNLRELRNAVEYAVAVCTSGLIKWADLPESVRNAHSPPSTPTVLGPLDVVVPAVSEGHGKSQLTQVRGDAERELVLQTLRKNGNNRSRAASELGISRVTLYKRMQKLGIQSIYAG